MIKPKHGVFILSAVLMIFNFLLLRALWINHYVENLIELTLFFVAINFIARIPSVEQFIKSLPRAHQWLVAIFLFTAATGQTLGNSEATFPFPSWDMYEKKIELQNAKYYRYIGVTSAGEEIHLNSTAAYPSLLRFRHDVVREHVMDAYLRNADYPVQPADRESVEITASSNLKARVGQHFRHFFAKKDLTPEFQEQWIKTSARAIAQSYMRRSKGLTIESIKIIRGFLTKSGGQYIEEQKEIMRFPLKEDVNDAPSS